MTERRKYEKPSMKVFELKQKPTLLAGSNPPPTTASVDDLQDGGTISWD